MVQGLPAVDWKDAKNNAKLFAAVLALIPGTPDYKKIASVFGPDVPPSAISYRLSVVRKEAAGLGFTSGSSSASTPVKKTNGFTTAAKRAAPAAKKNAAKGYKRGRELSDDESDERDTAMVSEEEEIAVETDSENTPSKPAYSAKRQKTISGRVTKRSSPRKGKNTNYKTLDDPFVTMDSAQDENGNNVFGEPSGTDSEDTYASDGSFKAPGKDSAVKIEEADEAV